MLDPARFPLFLAAAFILAITPGPGIFYVLTRSIKGGRSEGIASALGTGVGGFGHVFAAALGLSALLATSALAFGVIKYAGAAYLIYLGIRTLFSNDHLDLDAPLLAGSNRRAFRQGIATEMLNPKTALFFLAFIPQFVNPHAPVLPQFLLLGLVSVLLNTSADFVVAAIAGPLGQWLRGHARFRRGQQIFSGCGLIALGAYVALAGDEKV